MIGLYRTVTRDSSLLLTPSQRICLLDEVFQERSHYVPDHLACVDAASVEPLMHRFHHLACVRPVICLGEAISYYLVVVTLGVVGRMTAETWTCRA